MAGHPLRVQHKPQESFGHPQQPQHLASTSPSVLFTVFEGSRNLVSSGENGSTLFLKNVLPKESSITVGLVLPGPEKIPRGKSYHSWQTTCQAFHCVN